MSTSEDHRVIAMPLESEIVIVSGLPRSGTSLLMQMLDSAGVPALTDEIRQPDTDNPRGYFEYERVKKTKDDPSWVAEARGKVVKMVSSLLYDLPDTETYRIVFIERNIDEVLASQIRMLERRRRISAPVDQIKDSFAIHLKRLFEWLQIQRNMKVMKVSYNRLLTESERECNTIAAFLDHQPDVQRMLDSIVPALYRNRREV